MKFIKSFLLIIITMNLAFAGNSLTSAFEFLRTDFNPRTSAMSNAFTTLRGDVGTMLVNPAGMAYSEHDQWSVAYTNYILDINGGLVAYSRKMDKIGILSASIQYIDYGSFAKTDDYALETGVNFSAADLAFSVGIADHLDENFSYGANLKYIYSNIENYNASSVAIDLGLLYKAPFTEDLFFAFSMTNFGSNFEYYSGTKESLPSGLRFGVSKKLAHLPLEIGLSIVDINKVADNFADRLKRFSVGGEFRLSETLRFRLGYNNQLHNDMKADNIENTEFGGISAGFGIYLKNFRIDYAYSDYYLLGNVHRFGISGAID